MARKVTEEEVCDVCGATGPIEPVTVTLRGKVSVAECCERCLEPVRAIAEAGSTKPRRKGPTTAPKPQGHRVVPIA